MVTRISLARLELRLRLTFLVLARTFVSAFVRSNFRAQYSRMLLTIEDHALIPTMVQVDPKVKSVDILFDPAQLAEQQEL